MSLARYSNQRDGNEKNIVDAMQSVGASVYRLDQPCDLLVGYRGKNYLIEVKLPLGPRGGAAHSKLNDVQEEFAATWRGQFEIVRSPEDAIEAITGSVIRTRDQKSVPLH